MTLVDGKWIAGPMTFPKNPEKCIKIKGGFSVPNKYVKSGYKIIKAEIKSQSPWYTHGKSGATTYPVTSGQLQKLGMSECVWFLATKPTDKEYRTKQGVTASELHGKIFKINAKKLLEYICVNNENDSPHLYRYDGTQTWDMENNNYKDKSRIAVPFEMLKEVGQIDAKIMQESGINTSATAHISKWTNGEFKTWRNLTEKKGYIGEKLMQMEYFDLQDGVVNTSVLADNIEDKFAKIDMIIIFDKEGNN